MEDPLDAELTTSERLWIECDQALRDQARVLAAQLGRDEEGIYRTLKNLERSPSQRLELGLRHGRLHPKYR